MEPAEQAAGSAHVGADGLAVDMLKCVQSEDALKQRVFSSGVVLFEDTLPHPESIEFLGMVVQEDDEDLVW